MGLDPSGARFTLQHSNQHITDKLPVASEHGLVYFGPYEAAQAHNRRGQAG